MNEIQQEESIAVGDRVEANGDLWRPGYPFHPEGARGTVLPANASVSSGFVRVLWDDDDRETYVATFALRVLPSATGCRACDETGEDCPEHRDPSVRPGVVGLRCCGGIYVHRPSCNGHRHAQGGPRNCPTCREMTDGAHRG